MRGAGFEPALPEERRLKRRVLDHSTTRAKSRFIFIFMEEWTLNTILTFHIQTDSLSPFPFPNRAEPS